MDSQLHRQHHNEEDNQNAGEGEHEHHKSVLKKVKDKAKKIKKKITHHGHEQGHDLTDEDDEDEEMDADPETHGAPMYESTVISCTNLPRQIDPNLEKPADAGENRYDANPKVRDEGIHRPSPKMGTEFGLHPNVRDEGVQDEGIHRPSAKTEAESGMHPTVQDEGIHRPSSKMGAGFGTPTLPPAIHGHGVENKNTLASNLKRENPNVRIGAPMGLEEDPHSHKTHPADNPPSNYESKVTDPTRSSGEEANVSPLVHRFDNLNVRDESESKTGSEQRSFTGSHDQFAAQPIPTKDQFNPDSNPKSFDSTKPESMPQDTVAGKISSATSAIAEKAISAKNVVASKLGYGGSTHLEETSHDTSKRPVTELATEYAHTVYDKVTGAGSAVMSKVQGGSSGGLAPTESNKKPVTESVAEKLAPVYGKVAGAGSAMMSKVQGGTGEGAENQVASDKDKGVSMKEYLVEKLRPGDEDKALSEAITDVLQKKKGGVVVVEEEKKKPLGKVTESEEVARRLGTGRDYKREGDDAMAAGSESSGQGVVERVKDAVGLWLGKSTGMQTAQESVGQAHVSGAGASSTTAGGEEEKGQRRQQESSN